MKLQKIKNVYISPDVEELYEKIMPENFKKEIELIKYHERKRNKVYQKRYLKKKQKQNEKSENNKK